MSSISSIGSSSQWPTAATQRPPNARMQEKILAKMDEDGSGGVSQSEFQTAITDITSQTGVELDSSAEDLFSGADSDGDGSLSASELGTAMQSVLPPPPDTVAFAQSRSASGTDGPPAMGGMRPPPPPAGGVASSESSDTTDPLDTNSDGVVSAAERAAAAETDPLQALMKTLDADQDGQISETEVDSFVKQLTAQLEAAAKEYAQTASGTRTTTTGTTLSATA